MWGITCAAGLGCVGLLVVLQACSVWGITCAVGMGCGGVI